MALATTCPQCKTSFKVVPDQLKLRRGMVRCGVCQNVFSGIDFLRYVDEGPKHPNVARPGGSIFTAAASPGSPAGDPGETPPAPVPADPSDNGTPTQQGDLKTAFFLPETIFHPTTRIDAPDSHLGTPATAMLPESLRREPSPQPATTPASDAGRRDAALPSPSAHGAGAEGHPADATGRTPSRPPDAEGIGAGDDAADVWADPQQMHGSYVDTDEHGLPRLDSETAIDLGAGPGIVAGPPPGNRAGRYRGGSPDAQRAPFDEDQDRREASSRPERTDEGRRPHRSGGGPSQLAIAGADGVDAIDYFSGSDQGHGFSSRSLPLKWAAAAGLSLLLLAQLAIGARHWIVTSFPQVQGVLSQWLAPLHVTIEPPRDLASLTIESFELQATSAPGILSASALLRNRAGYDVQWPALELSLTDGNGALLVRKVILPDDYLKNAPDASDDGRLAIRPRAELPVKLAFEARNLSPSGFTVSLFYP